MYIVFDAVTNRRGVRATTPKSSFQKNPRRRAVNDSAKEPSHYFRSAVSPGACRLNLVLPI